MSSWTEKRLDHPQAATSASSAGLSTTTINAENIGSPSDINKPGAVNVSTQVGTEVTLGPDVEVARVQSRTPIHSVFTRYQKWFIVFMSAWGGLFSPLSGNIYLPALNVLSDQLQVSDTLINLTLTSYMIFQGLAPIFIGEIAENAGRRPAYVICFTIYIAANIGLALQRSYPALFILRCLQSAGSSSTIALASAVVADVATSAERGTWMGLSQAGSLLGPAVGPVLGGVLAQFLGWPAIFWFLAIMAGVFFIIFGVVFPETGRKIVGDGSIPPPRLNWSLINYLQFRKSRQDSHLNDNSGGLARTRTQEELERKKRQLAASRKLRWPNPVRVLRLTLEKDVALLLFYNSLVYTAFYMVTTSTPSLFASIYGFNELQIGLAYLPFGIGSCVSTYIWGALTDWNFRRIARRRNLPYDRRRALDLTNFPLEKSRLDVIFPLTYAGSAVILAYGWLIEYNAPLAPVLVLQFLVGLLVSGAFNVMSVMVVDLYPESPASATACNNLFRCLVGAAGTALVIDMINAMGRGWFFTFVALVMVAFSPMIWLLLFKGPKWRAERKTRLDRLKEEERVRDGMNVSSEKENAAAATAAAPDLQVQGPRPTDGNSPS